ncbi:fatty acid desaturase [Brevibacterium sanguinis]|uniref:Fatty acid desaturase n=2 Tax=Brevibacterium TaxID=1696 RepID=A0A366INU2_9MICO|nr:MULTISPECIES: acyl-CoA desaturase [Brevibacterium]RBP67034.1 fatty acid desaturase [Brevibacterium sanguinis]RBP73559.1 fatty acid desaturase [Brevibacterium celere]
MSAEAYVDTYRRLSSTVHDAGLMRRRPGFYLVRIGGWLGALAGLLTVVVLLGATWFQLIAAGLIGLVLAQLGFLSHEAAHRQVFSSREANEWLSRIVAGLVMGLSFGWWMAKHNTHHAYPNHEGTDPDIESTLIALTPDAARRRRGLGAYLARHQGIFFVPLLFLEGLNLHVASLRMLLGAREVSHRMTEIALILVRHGAYLTLLFLILPFGMAFAFVGVQVGAFGILLGGAFALNHIGRPSVPRGVNVDFLRRQVVLSRNIKDGPVVRFLMGGLQFQIEHHLFPAAPRPNLSRMQQIVRSECAQRGIPYVERTLAEATATVIAYLNQVGVRNQDPYACPLVRRYRG